MNEREIVKNLMEKHLDPDIEGLILEMNTIGLVTKYSGEGHGQGCDYVSAYVTIDLKAMSKGALHVSPDGLVTLYWDRK